MVLRDHQRKRIGKGFMNVEKLLIPLGTPLIRHVARRFLSLGVNDMVLFGVPQNPSCSFHEAMGGERLYSEKGTFGGGYRWRDLKKLAAF